MSKFVPLFSLTITHAYYGGPCQDFAYVLPGDSARVLANGHLVAKPRDGKLVVWYEADDTNQPVVRAEGHTVRIGLVLLNQQFSNFTTLAAAPMRFANDPNPQQLAGPAPTTLDFELQQQGALGIVDVRLDASFYTTAPDFTIAFAAKQETLKYYLVARNFSNAEVGQLAVSDAGFTEEARPEVTFTKVAAAAFTPAEIPAAALAGAGATVLLFKSQAAVPRRASARKKIQVRRNTEILVKHLPPPSSDSATADVIVHVSKT